MTYCTEKTSFCFKEQRGKKNWFLRPKWRGCGNFEWPPRPQAWAFSVPQGEGRDMRAGFSMHFPQDEAEAIRIMGSTTGLELVALSAHLLSPQPRRQLLWALTGLFTHTTFLDHERPSAPPPCVWSLTYLAQRILWSPPGELSHCINLRLGQTRLEWI